jgi:chromosomal replication initiator protein
VDLDLAREVLDHICGPGGAPDVATIKRVVCRTYHLSEAELVSKSRYKRIVVPRNLAMYFTRRYTEMSFAAIGEVFGREHATVMHSVRRIERQLREDQRFAHQARYLQKKIEAEGQPDPARN